MDSIKSFSGPWRFLSNFWMCEIKLLGVIWPSSEHFYQAMKTLNSNDREMIRRIPTPGKAKRKSSKVEMRPDWDAVKESIMESVVKEKFNQNPILRKRLVNTGTATIVEGNRWHDNFWGNCTCEKCKDIKGQNKLGRILMRIRRQYGK